MEVTAHAWLDLVMNLTVTSPGSPGTPHNFDRGERGCRFGVQSESSPGHRRIFDLSQFVRLSESARTQMEVPHMRGAQWT